MGYCEFQEERKQSSIIGDMESLRFVEWGFSKVNFESNLDGGGL